MRWTRVASPNLMQSVGTKAIVMKEVGFKNFGDLYRAAYAEPTIERKILLMSQVKQARDDWAQTSAARNGAIVGESAVVFLQID